MRLLDRLRKIRNIAPLSLAFISFCLTVPVAAATFNGTPVMSGTPAPTDFIRVTRSLGGSSPIQDLVTPLSNFLLPDLWECASTAQCTTALGHALVLDDGLTVTGAISATAGVQPNGTANGYTPEFDVGGALSTVHPLVVTGTCASVTSGGNSCTFGNSFAFPNTTFQCVAVASGTTPEALSYAVSSNATTSAKFYAAATTNIVYTCFE